MAKYGKWGGNKNKDRQLLQLSQHQLVLRPIKDSDFTLADDVTSSLQDPHLWALSIIYILSFFSLQCVLDGCLSYYFPSHHPTGYLCLHCTWNSSTKLQKETPGTTDTLKWKSSDPCGKNTPGISNIDIYVPLSKIYTGVTFSTDAA